MSCSVAEYKAVKMKVTGTRLRATSSINRVRLGMTLLDCRGPSRLILPSSSHRLKWSVSTLSQVNSGLPGRRPQTGRSRTPVRKGPRWRS